MSPECRLSTLRQTRTQHRQRHTGPREGRPGPARMPSTLSGGTQSMLRTHFMTLGFSRAGTARRVDCARSGLQEEAGSAGPDHTGERFRFGGCLRRSFTERFGCGDCGCGSRRRCSERANDCGRYHARRPLPRSVRAPTPRRDPWARVRQSRRSLRPRRQVSLLGGGVAACLRHGSRAHQRWKRGRTPPSATEPSCVAATVAATSVRS